MYRRQTPKNIGNCVGVRNLRLPTTEHLSYIEKHFVIVTSNMSKKSLMHMTIRPLIHKLFNFISRQQRIGVQKFLRRGIN